jgi:hypothetical protein
MYLGYLKQNVAATAVIGSFVAAADGFTPYTTATLATSNAFKNNNVAVSVSGLTWTHLANGVYSLSLTAAETNIAGNFVINITHATNAHRPVTVAFTVLSAAAYDALFNGNTLPANIMQINTLPITQWSNGSSQLNADVKAFNANPASALLTDATHLRVDVDSIDGSTIAATNQKSAALGIVVGAVNGAATTTSIPTNLLASDNDQYNGRTIIFTNGLVYGEAAKVVDYDQPSQTLTISALTRAPVDTTTFVIV